MKKTLFILTLLISVCASAQMKKIISTRPAPPKLVNDYTNTLTPLQKEALETKLYQYDDSTSNQVAIVMVETTDDYSIEDAAIELGRNWGVGDKDFNNGVVILVAKSDRKTTIQVGYGLEGAIPDVTAKAIIDNDIIPNFKEDNYYRGLDRAVDDIIKAAEGRYTAPAGYHKKKKGLGFGTILLIVILLFIFFGGAAAGGAGGTLLSGGSRTGRRGWSGGGWSGGGGSSGGFGGFGGGSFGGGGASGSW